MYRIACYGLISLYLLLLLFHILVLSGLIPFDIIWGGRLENHEEMVRFESAAIIITLLFLLPVLMETKMIPIRANRRVLSALFWLIALYFALNTLGNLAAKQSLETLLFTPLSLLLVIFNVVLARHRP